MPERVKLKLVRPPDFRRTANGKFEAELREQLRLREDAIRSRFKLEGRKFLGVHGIRKIRPFDSPASREPRRNLNPRIACMDVGLRVAAIGRLKAFRDDYRNAYRQWKAGKRGVIFPCGTYQLRVQAGVRCRAPCASRHGSAWRSTQPAAASVRAAADFK